jgi:hypothetical protein
MTRLLRLCKILFVILYYGLDELVLSGFKNRRIKSSSESSPSVASSISRAANACAWR